ncbi:hypothetical protein Ciccas_001795 [Cichlidogyrus casuarinus]|uniref:PH domain-containing protein n=1 Tax=Cichlidogyrus casuarinus TaxID=1844966 RepID=A0ABD2QJ47_9PLAT
MGMHDESWFEELKKDAPKKEDLQKLEEARSSFQRWRSDFKSSLEQRLQAFEFRSQIEDILRDIEVMKLRLEKRSSVVTEASPLFTLMSVLTAPGAVTIDRATLEETSQKIDRLFQNPLARRQENQHEVRLIKEKWEAVLKHNEVNENHSKNPSDLGPVKDICSRAESLELVIFEVAWLLRERRMGGTLKESQQLLLKVRDPRLRDSGIDEFCTRAEEVRKSLEAKNSEKMAKFVARLKESISSRWGEINFALVEYEKLLEEACAKHERDQKIQLMSLEAVRLQQQLPIVADDPEASSIDLQIEDRKLRRFETQLLALMKDNKSEQLQLLLEKLNSELEQEKITLRAKNDLHQRMQLCNQVQDWVNFLSTTDQDEYCTLLPEFEQNVQKQKLALTQAKSKQFLPQTAQSALPHMHQVLDQRIKSLEEELGAPVEAKIARIRERAIRVALMNSYQQAVQNAKAEMKLMDSRLAENPSDKQLIEFETRLEQLLRPVHESHIQLQGAKAVSTAPQQLVQDANLLSEKIEKTKKELSLERESQVWSLRATKLMRRLEKLIKESREEGQEWEEMISSQGFVESPAEMLEDMESRCRALSVEEDLRCAKLCLQEGQSLSHELAKPFEVTISELDAANTARKEAKDQARRMVSLVLRLYEHNSTVVYCEISLKHANYATFTELQLEDRKQALRRLLSDLIRPAQAELAQIKEPHGMVQQRCESILRNLDDVLRATEMQICSIDQWIPFKNLQERQLFLILKLLKNLLKNDIISDDSMETMGREESLLNKDDCQLTKLSLQNLARETGALSERICVCLEQLSQFAAGKETGQLARKNEEKLHFLVSTIAARMQIKMRRVQLREFIERQARKLSAIGNWLRRLQKDLQNTILRDEKAEDGYLAFVRTTDKLLWLQETLSNLRQRHHDLDQSEDCSQIDQAVIAWLNTTLGAQMFALLEDKQPWLNDMEATKREQTELSKVFTELETRFASLIELFRFRQELQQFEIKANNFNDWLRSSLKRCSLEMDPAKLNKMLVDGAAMRSDLVDQYEQVTSKLKHIGLRERERELAELVDRDAELVNSIERTLTNNWSLLVDSANKRKVALTEREEAKRFWHSAREMQLFTEDRNSRLDGISWNVPEVLSREVLANWGVTLDDTAATLNEVHDEVKGPGLDALKTKFIGQVQKCLLEENWNALELRVTSLLDKLGPRQQLKVWLEDALNLADWLRCARNHLDQISDQEMEQKMLELAQIEASANVQPKEAIVRSSVAHLTRQLDSLKTDRAELQRKKDMLQDLELFYRNLHVTDQLLSQCEGTQADKSAKLLRQQSLDKELDKQSKLVNRLELLDKLVNDCKKVTLVEKNLAPNKRASGMKQLWTEIRVDPAERYVPEPTTSTVQERPKSWRWSSVTTDTIPVFDEPCLKSIQVYAKVLEEMDGSQVMTPKWHPSQSRSKGYTAALYTKELLLFKNKFGQDERPLYRLPLQGLKVTLVQPSTDVRRQLSIRKRHEHRLRLTQQKGDMILAFPTQTALSDWQQSLTNVCALVANPIIEQTNI